MLRLTVAACAAAAVVGGGVTWALAAPDSSAGPTPVAEPSAERTSFAGLAPADGEPTLSGLGSAAPEPGRVGQVAGPFDDRFTLSSLALADGRVSGSLRVTSDVSDLLELQVLVAYYDASGDLLGVRRSTHHATGSHVHTGPPSEVERFAVAAPARFRGDVRSAAVGVPVLVNE
jgi:hypothetical protein